MPFQFLRGYSEADDCGETPMLPNDNRYAYLFFVIIASQILGWLVNWNFKVFLELKYAPAQISPAVPILAVAYAQLQSCVLCIVAWHFLRRLKCNYSQALQLRLATLLTVTVAASLILLLNVQGVIPGWPEHIYFHDFQDPPPVGYHLRVARPIILNLIYGITILIVVAFVCESFVFFAGHQIATSPNVTAPQLPIRFLAPPPPEEALQRSRALTKRECWIYAIPMILFFVSVISACIIIENVQGDFRRYRLDLPLYSVAAITIYRLLSSSCLILPLLMIAVSAAYCFWVVNDRRRVFWFNATLFALMLFGFIGVAMAVIGPFLFRDGCVASGTEVDTQGGKRRIDDLQAGDEILTLSPGGELQPGVIQRKLQHESQNSLVFTLSTGVVLRVTHEHPIATDAEWRRAGTLKVGDVVRTVRGNVIVERIELKEEPVVVFDLTVSPNPNFFANGVLVHNAMKKK
jgi:hypothetical protein